MLVSTLAALALAAAVDAPVTAVTVFSDRARVTRTAQVSANGTQSVELPLLLDGIDPASVRLTASGAEVRRVDLAHIEADAFPANQAKALLDQLDALDDQLRLADAQRQSAQALLNALDRIRPTLPPSDPQKPAPRLNASGWAQSLGFAAKYRDNLQAKVRDALVKTEELSRQRDKLLVEARKIDAGRRGGWRVTASIAGTGPAKLDLTYVAQNARWYPAYDLTLVPDGSQVQVAFAALVSQETGEDWNDARLTVSTAVPASSTVFPKLLSWKIGEKERFIPTASPAPEQVPPAPRTVPPLKLANLDEAMLRQRLAARLGQAVDPSVAPEEPQYEFQDSEISGDLRKQDKEYAAKPEAKPRPKKSVAAPPPAPSRREYNAPAAQAPAAAPAAPPSYAVTESMEEVSTRGGEAAYQPTMSVGLAPPPGYTPPSYAANLPVSLAGGYDLAFHSVQTESVPSGGGAKRVALFAQRWPVTVERKLFPALAPEAFLVAELKNPSSALPGGDANLHVGNDPAGTAHLGFVAPGEEFTLPLGLDRALKPIRNVKLVEAEKGFIGKDQVNRYDVTTELANPYDLPIAVKIFDQWPVTDDEHVEVKLVSTRPFAKQDAVKGSLEWDLTLPPHAKTTVSYSYTLKTPKNYKLHQ